MKLAAFDLDNTLLAGDSDYAWGQYLVARGHVDADHYARANQQFYADYQAGNLDIHAYAEFAMGTMGRIDPSILNQLREDFIRDELPRMVAPGARALLQAHRDNGAEIVIITATNTYITRPIAQALGVPNLIGTEPEFEQQRMTGRIQGTPCFQAGKITKLKAWLAERAPRTTWFYSDSVNDLPLLEHADHPVVVDPCPRLLQIAQERQWPIMSLRA